MRSLSIRLLVSHNTQVKWVMPPGFVSAKLVRVTQTSKRGKTVATCFTRTKTFEMDARQLLRLPRRNIVARDQASVARRAVIQENQECLSRVEAGCVASGMGGLRLIRTVRGGVESAWSSSLGHGADA